MVFVTERSASSWNSIGGAGVVVDVEVLSHSAIRSSCFLIFSWIEWVDPISEVQNYKKKSTDSKPQKC